MHIHTTLYAQTTLIKHLTLISLQLPTPLIEILCK